METERLRVELRDGVARMTLNRPDVRNALDGALLRDLKEAFALLERDPGVRSVVLGGAGKIFCAGADVHAMTQGDPRADAQGLADVLRAIEDFPAPVIGRVHGAAMGGGSGLIAACDLVAASEDAKFAFSEVKLGIVPGVISAVVVPKIGASQARRYFLTAERFDAAEALRIGLLHAVVDEAKLDATVQGIVEQLLKGGPKAQAAAKDLIGAVVNRPVDRALVEDTAERIARIRSSPEGREGVSAFLDKRRASWVPPPEPEAPAPNLPPPPGA